MSTNSFEKTFVIDDMESVKKLLKIIESEPHPIDTSRHTEIKEDMERSEQLLRKHLFRLGY